MKYTITQLRDVRAWRKVEMQFADDAAAAARVAELAKALRAGGEVPREHPLTDAGHSSDYETQGRQWLFCDRDEDEDGDGGDIAEGDGFTPDEAAADHVGALLAALIMARDWLTAIAPPDVGTLERKRLAEMNAAIARAQGDAPDAANAAQMVEG